MAAALQARGVGPGAHVAILGPTTRPLVTAIQATWLCGAATVMLPLPMRLGSIDEFVAQTRARILASDAVARGRRPAARRVPRPGPGDPPIVLLDELARRSRAPTARTSARPTTPTRSRSCSTRAGRPSDPQGRDAAAPLRHREPRRDRGSRAASTPASTVGVSWLPLYHDMGLIGLLTIPMTTGMDLALAAPQDFLAAPAQWMQWMLGLRRHRHRRTELRLRARGARAAPPRRPRPVGRGGSRSTAPSPIDPDAVERFVAAGAPHGLAGGAVFPAFGMAEATLAVTFPEPGLGPRPSTSIDGRVLETEQYAAPVATDTRAARRLARLGRPVPGSAVRVVRTRHRHA